MKALIDEIQHSPLLWLLVFVPVVFAVRSARPQAHTLLFVLAVLAIVPLAALLSHATESVAAKTGDAVGGLLNATLGNLTELVIALAALRAGEYMLVKASLAGAIVSNALFMLGGSFLLGGLRHHVLEFNSASARLSAGLLFLATVGLLVPSLVSQADAVPAGAVGSAPSVALSVLLIAGYALGLVFSLRTHKEEFAGVSPAESETPGRRDGRTRVRQPSNRADRNSTVPAGPASVSVTVSAPGGTCNSKRRPRQHWRSASIARAIR